MYHLSPHGQLTSAVAWRFAGSKTMLQQNPPVLNWGSSCIMAVKW